MQATPHITIDIVSDVVCPWCYIGLKRLDAAMVSVDNIAVDIKWRPYQLDATIPAGGLDRRQYMVAKFGSEQRLDEILANVTEAGRSVGIAFDLDAIKVSPNTLDAHRLIRWAGSGEHNLQTAVKKRLMQAFFEEGRNIGDHAVLIDIARETGMDAAVVEALLATDADIPETKAEIETAQRMGVTGVPCFLFESRYAVMGAQDPAVLADAIQQIAGAKARGELGPAA